MSDHLLSSSFLPLLLDLSFGDLKYPLAFSSTWNPLKYVKRVTRFYSASVHFHVIHPLTSSTLSVAQNGFWTLHHENSFLNRHWLVDSCYWAPRIHKIQWFLQLKTHSCTQKVYIHSLIRISSANTVTQNCEPGGRQLQLVISSDDLVTAFSLVGGNFTLKHFGFVKFYYCRPLSLCLLNSDGRADSYCSNCVNSTCSPFFSVALRVAALVPST